MKDNGYQKYYENNIGKATINIKKAVAGDKINCLLTYTVGKLGIDDTGSLKVIFRLASDIAETQFEDKKQNNFVDISSSNKNVKIAIDSRSEGSKRKMGIRAWSRGFCLIFYNDYLKQGDKIYIRFKNWRIQTFCEENFEFKILVDPFATSKYIELPTLPSIKIIPGTPKKLVIVSPSKIEKNNTFSSLIKIEDKWRNPCRLLNGTFEIINNKKLGCAKKVSFKKGRTILKIKENFPKDKKILYIKTKYKNLHGTSNPIFIDRDKKLPRYFWAELHAQSGETIGTNSIDNYFHFAKNYAGVDILCHQGNDFQISNEFWKKINSLASSYNKDKKFVAFPGYEWSGNTASGGDRNIIYLNEGEPIYRSSHALVDDYHDIKNDIVNAKDLFQKLKNRKVIVAAHVGGRYADLDIHNNEIEKLVEVHSCWGTFEWFLSQAMKNNHIVGIVANSDGHDGRPGASHPGASHFSNIGGLTCILADSLDRKTIFKELKKRHCYATTGARIFLDISLKNERKKKAIMGDIISYKNSKYLLSVNVLGTNMVERVEIYNKNKVIKTYYPKIEDSQDKKFVKFIWQGAKNRSRDRSKDWSGKIHLQNWKIGKIQTVNFLNAQSQFKISKNIITWNGKTRGNKQGLILPIEKQNNKNTLIKMEVNDKSFSIPFDSISAKPKKYGFDGLNAYIEIYQTSKNTKPSYIEFEEKLSKLNKGLNSIFIKVTQRDGHLAWSSPVFIKK